MSPSWTTTAPRAPNFPARSPLRQRSIPKRRLPLTTQTSRLFAAGGLPIKFKASRKPLPGTTQRNASRLTSRLTSSFKEAPRPLPLHRPRKPKLRAQRHGRQNIDHLPCSRSTAPFFIAIWSPSFPPCHAVGRPRPFSLPYDRVRFLPGSWWYRLMACRGLI